MPQQVDDLHRPRRRPGLEGGRDTGDEDTKVPPGGDELLHGVVEGDAALFDEHHEGDRGDRLGHRIDAEDGVLFQRHAAGDVGVTLDGEVGDLPSSGDQGEGAGKATGVDVAGGDEVIDALKA